MARFAEAGLQSNGSAAATPGVIRATIRSPSEFEDRTEVNENRNMILAVVLSALVLIGWSFLAERLLLAPEPAPRTEQASDGQTAPAPQPQVGTAEGTPTKLRPRGQVISETPRLQIRTPSLRGSVNLRGARIDDLVLLRERMTIDRQSPAVRLLSPA